MHTHADSIQQQFDSQAEAYLHSAVHASGVDLARAVEWVAETLPPRHSRALDVGSGAGHLSFALAPCLAEVVALDPSPGMLATVAQAAAQRGLPQVRTQQASAHDLPFGDGHFDLAASRYSAHHWTALPAALREMRRVLKPGGHLLMIDVLGCEQPLVDTHLQAIELLRDRSHVRNRSHAQWLATLRDAGFAVQQTEQLPLRLDFATWVARMRTPAELTSVIRRLQRDAPEDVQRALAYEPDGSFTVRTGLYWAVSAAV